MCNNKGTIGRPMQATAVLWSLLPLQILGTLCHLVPPASANFHATTSQQPWIQPSSPPMTRLARTSTPTSDNKMLEAVKNICGFTYSCDSKSAVSGCCERCSCQPSCRIARNCCPGVAFAEDLITNVYLPQPTCMALYDAIPREKKDTNDTENIQSSSSGHNAEKISSKSSNLNIPQIQDSKAQQSHFHESHLLQTGLLGIHNPLTHYHSQYLVVNSCLSAHHSHSSQCEAPDTRSIIDYIPVTSVKTGYIYRNYHCAECNNVGDHKYWQLSTNCVELYLSNVFPDTIEDFLNLTQHCLYHIVPPTDRDISNQVCRTRVKDYVITQCNVTGHWDRFDGQLEALCQDELSVALYEREFQGETRQVYKNVFCYLCNRKQSQSLTEHCTETEQNQQLDYNSKQAFHANLDISQSLVQSPATAPGECPRGQVRDKYTHSCRKFICPVFANAVGDQCITKPGKVQGFTVKATLKVTLLGSSRTTTTNSGNNNSFNSTGSIINDKDPQNNFSLISKNDNNCHTNNINNNNIEQTTKSPFALKHQVNTIHDSIMHSINVDSSECQMTNVKVLSSSDIIHISCHIYMIYQITSTDTCPVESVLNMFQKLKNLTISLPAIIRNGSNINNRGSLHLDAAETEEASNNNAPMHLLDSHEHTFSVEVDYQSLNESQYDFVFSLSGHQDTEYHAHITLQTPFFFCPRVILSVAEYNKLISYGILKPHKNTFQQGHANTMGQVEMCYSDYIQHWEVYQSHHEQVKLSLNPNIITTSVSTVAILMAISLQYMSQDRCSGLASEKMFIVLSVNLIVAQTSLVTGDLLFSINNCCNLTGVIIHLSWLATILSLNFCLWLTLMNSGGSCHGNDQCLVQSDSNIYWYLLWIYLIPATLIGVNYLASWLQRISSYGGQACFIASQTQHLVTFTMPMILCLCVSIAMLIIQYSNKESGNVRDCMNAKLNWHMHLMLAVLFGITWFVRYLVSSTGIEGFVYVFHLLTTAHGMVLLWTKFAKMYMYVMYLRKCKKCYLESDDSEQFDIML